MMLSQGQQQNLEPAGRSLPFITTVLPGAGALLRAFIENEALSAEVPVWGGRQSTDCPSFANQRQRGAPSGSQVRKEVLRLIKQGKWTFTC